MKPHKPDKMLVTLFVILSGIGLFSLFDASSVRGEITYNDPFYYFKRQLLFFAIGMIGFWILYSVPHAFWKRFSFLIILVGFSLMLSVFLPHVGLTLKGAMRWIQIGPFSLQPAEFFKLALIVYLASFFAKHQAQLDNFWQTAVPFAVIVGSADLILAAQRSLGMLIIVSCIGFAMYFFAGAPVRTLALLVMTFSAVVALLVLIEPYRMERILTFLQPSQSDTQGSGYQVNQALIGIGSGGALGVGLGHSRQKFAFLPETMGDSIFAIWAEETGFVGATFLLILIGIFVWRGFTAARFSKDMYAKLIASGITCWIAGQALFNIAAISGLAPLSGIPLPFFSYGGSALMSIMFAYALLLNVSRYAARK